MYHHYPQNEQLVFNLIIRIESQFTPDIPLFDERFRTPNSHVVNLNMRNRNIFHPESIIYNHLTVLVTLDNEGAIHECINTTFQSIILS
jgi:hypothetical protein